MFLLSYDIVQGSPCIDIKCLISRSTTLLSLLKLQWVIYGQQNKKHKGGVPTMLRLDGLNKTEVSRLISRGLSF